MLWTSHWKLVQQFNQEILQAKFVSKILYPNLPLCMRKLLRLGKISSIDKIILVNFLQGMMAYIEKGVVILLLHFVPTACVYIISLPVWLSTTTGEIPAFVGNSFLSGLRLKFILNI